MRVVVFLLLGAVVNVAVVLAFALWGSTRFTYEQFPSRGDDPRWLCGVDDGLGKTRTSFAPDNGNWGREDRNPDGLILPYWSRANTPPSTETMNDETMPWFNEHAYGWPMRVGISELCNRKPARAWVVTHGIEVLHRNDGSPTPFRDLPLRPIWPGFAINTFFYAGILCLLFAGPGKVRRWRRIRRGLCAKCAYPVGASDVCTECGAQINKEFKARGSMGPRVAN